LYGVCCPFGFLSNRRTSTWNVLWVEGRFARLAMTSIIPLQVEGHTKERNGPISLPLGRMTPMMAAARRRRMLCVTMAHEEFHRRWIV
jgi:hypothetical protein